MAMKLSRTLIHLDSIPDPVNASLVKEFYEYLKQLGTSENYQNQNLKQLINFAKHLGAEKTMSSVKTKDDIIAFLNTKIKDHDLDPDKRWITTWNDYLWRIKYFFRWLYNYRIVKDKGEEPTNNSDWITPSFLLISKKKSKRISPYLEGELWEKEDLLCIIKYEHHKRNKAILSLLWDLDARPHEVTLLKIKHVRLKDKYSLQSVMISAENEKRMLDLFKDRINTIDFSDPSSLEQKYSISYRELFGIIFRILKENPTNYKDNQLDLMWNSILNDKTLLYEMESHFHKQGIAVYGDIILPFTKKIRNSNDVMDVDRINQTWMSLNRIEEKPQIAYLLLSQFALWNENVTNSIVNYIEKISPDILVIKVKNLHLTDGSKHAKPEKI